MAQRANVMWVPEEAVLQRADGAVVFRLIADDRVERVAVETGVHREGFVEVRSGLRPSDHVVTRGHASLVDGAVVSPRNLDGTPARPALAEAARETLE